MELGNLISFPIPSLEPAAVVKPPCSQSALTYMCLYVCIALSRPKDLV